MSMGVVWSFFFVWTCWKWIVMYLCHWIESFEGRVSNPWKELLLRMGLFYSSICLIGFDIHLFVFTCNRNTVAVSCILLWYIFSLLLKVLSRVSSSTETLPVVAVKSCLIIWFRTSSKSVEFGHSWLVKMETQL